MPSLINWELMASPYNWATVVLMILFGLALLAIISPEASQQ